MPTHSTELWPVPVQLLAAITSQLAKHGISAAQILADTNISVQDLQAHETLLPYRTAQQILQKSLELSPIAHLGFAVGGEQSPSSMGVLGYGINCCATIEDAMNMATKYYRVSSTFVKSKWYQKEDKLYWQATPPIVLGSILPCVIEEEFSMISRIQPMLTGQTTNLLEAHFQYPEPEYVSLYQDTFDCPLYFSAQYNQLVIDAEVLTQPILQANPLSVAAADRMCADFLRDNPTTDDMIMRIRQMILEQTYEYWNEEAIAARLNLTARTLRNQLRRLGTNYQAILDSQRKQIALEDLTNSILNVSDIAEHVGYSDVRAFRRAFKKWTGLTPSDYRSQYRGKQ